MIYQLLLTFFSLFFSHHQQTWQAISAFLTPQFLFIRLGVICIPSPALVTFCILRGKLNVAVHLKCTSGVLTVNGRTGISVLYEERSFSALRSTAKRNQNHSERAGRNPCKWKCCIKEEFLSFPFDFIPIHLQKFLNTVYFCATFYSSWKLSLQTVPPSKRNPWFLLSE